jgi:hypothetical protein
MIPKQEQCLYSCDKCKKTRYMKKHENKSLVFWMQNKKRINEVRGGGVGGGGVMLGGGVGGGGEKLCIIVGRADH